jgi:hypothetical protein
MRTEKDSGAESARAALEGWRRRSGGKGRRIPEEYWRAAVELARTRGVGPAARFLRLDSRKLGALLRASRPRPDLIVASDGFVELEHVAPRNTCGVTVVDLLSARGDRLRIEVMSALPVGMDLVELTRTFWSRST